MNADARGCTQIFDAMNDAMQIGSAACTMNQYTNIQISVYQRSSAVPLIHKASRRCGRLNRKMRYSASRKTAAVANDAQTAPPANEAIHIQLSTRSDARGVVATQSKIESPLSKAIAIISVRVASKNRGLGYSTKHAATTTSATGGNSRYKSRSSASMLRSSSICLSKVSNKADTVNQMST